MNDNDSEVERARRLLGRVGFTISAAGLVAGMVCRAAGFVPESTIVFQVAFAVLFLMPVKNVAAVLADEARRRDWWFVVLAAGVIAELGLNAWDRLR